MLDETGDAVVNNEEVAEDTTATGATTDETATSEGSDDQAFETVMGDDGEIKRVEKSTESNDDEGNEDESAGPKRGAEARREQLTAEMQSAQDGIRQLVAERNEILYEHQQLQAELQQMRDASQQAEMPTVEQLMDMENPETKDYYSEFEARSIVENLHLKQQLDTLTQEQETNEMNAKIAESVNGLSGEAQRALYEFPEFDSESPDYNAELSAEADEIVQNALIYDENGGVIGSNIPLYNIYKALSGARTSNRGVQVNADFRGSGQRSSKKFADLSTAEMEQALRRKGQLK